LNLLKRWRIGLLGLAVSLLAVYIIVSEIDFDVLGDAIQQADWIWVVPCMALLLAGLGARALRWRLLLSGALPLGRTFNIMNVAYLVNNILPLRIGEVARVFLANRAEPPVPVLKTTSTIIVERLLDLLSVVMLVAFALALGEVPEVLRSAGIFMGVVGLSGFLTLVFLSRQRELAHRLLGWFVERLPALERFNLVNLLDHFLDGLLPLASLPTLIGALWWSSVAWGLSFSAGYLMMYIFYPEASFVATCLYIAAAAFAIAVPATVGSLGVYEGSILLVMEALGYADPYTTAVAFAVTVHLINMVVNSSTGVIGFIAEGITLGQLSDGVRQVGQNTSSAAPHDLTRTELTP